MKSIYFGIEVFLSIFVYKFIAAHFISKIIEYRGLENMLLQLTGRKVDLGGGIQSIGLSGFILGCVFTLLIHLITVSIIYRRDV